MEKISFCLPNNMSALGLLGHMIVVNKQVHSYQIEELSRYFTACDSNIDETCLPSILDGKDDAVPFDQCLQAYSSETLPVQESLYYLLIVLAHVDDCLDEGEERILELVRQNSKMTPERHPHLFDKARNDALSLRTDNNVLFAKPYSDPKPRKSIFQQVVIWIRQLIRKIFHINTSAADNHPSSTDIDYKSAVTKCADIAKDDFAVIQPIYSDLISKCGNTVNELTGLKRDLDSSTTLSAEVAKAIIAFSDCLSENVLTQAKVAHASLLQKERTLPDFTISLLGRTKAGKSTLHAILTGHDRDKIGVGMQRTTRYNRVYQWNLLRIIDTPGIGSAEADGRSDDEIAASVLGESDIICFVVVDDSILQDVLEFIERIASLNKPLIVLLNHKENIRPEVKFKKYISNPTEWLTTEGEANLKGHINRITTYAQAHGFDSLLSVYPVFLLPALMAQEEEFKENSKILWESSNLDAFINELKKWITVSGPLKRSQTLIDGAIQNFSIAGKSIKQGAAPVREKIIDLKKRKPAIIRNVKNEQETLLKNLREYLTDMYDTLEHQEALSFAEEYYDYDGDLTPKWEAYLEAKNFSRDITTEVERLIGRFSSKIDDTVQEVFEDFYFSFQLGAKEIGLGNSLSFNFRSFTRILGGLFDVAGSIALVVLSSNPIGWVLIGIGTVIGLLSGIFKSKEKKRKEAIDKIYGKLSGSIHDEAPKQIEKTVSDIQKKTDEVIEKIDILFSKMIDGLEQTISAGDRLTHEFDQRIDFLNKVYAWRILTFLQGNTTLYHQEKVDELVFSADRDDRHIRIMTPEDTVLDPSVLKNIITEEIEIVKTEG